MDQSQSTRHKSVDGKLSADQGSEPIQGAVRGPDSDSLLKDMAAETGIEDLELLEKLLRFDITADTVRALELSPLFFVAWADGDMDQKEDEYIHDYIKNQGISLSGANHRLISHWFNVPPAPEYFEAWRLYIAGKLKSMQDNELKQRLKDETLMQIRELAEKSGGFLGLGSKISGYEHEQLKRFKDALA